MSETALQQLPGSPGCFICDNNNSNARALGLKIMWDEAAEKVQISFVPDQSWCGYADVVHGGLIAAVLDEAMAWAVRQKQGQWAFTADFQLRYKKPLQPGREYRAVAEFGDFDGRKITAQGQILDADNRPAAKATAIFLPAGDRARPRSVES
jgi:uncharacterized domain 1